MAFGLDSGLHTWRSWEKGFRVQGLGSIGAFKTNSIQGNLQFLVLAAGYIKNS